MSKWRDSLRDASFRGVSFFVTSQETSGGRRVQLHEYPLRDDPYAEDMGRTARRFSIECFVLGDDYMAAREQLLEALEEAGPGALIHPWKGMRQVAVEDYRMRESTREGGMATFTVRFVEAGRAAEPDISEDTAWHTDQAANTAKLAVQSEMASDFSTDGQPEWVRTSVTDLLSDLTDELTSIADLAAMPVAMAEAVVADIQAFQAEVLQVAGAVATLLATPATLAERVSALVSVLTGLADLSGWDILKRYRDLFEYADDLATAAVAVTTTATTSRRRQASNDLALARLVERTAIIEATRASSIATFSTYEEAAALRLELGEALDTAAATATDPAYRALTDLRTAMVRDLTARGANLARITTWTPPATLPSLVVAHKIYGDAEREGEIIARNRVRRPGAVPGGTPLEVRTDG